MKFNVYTDAGDYLGIWAKDARDAERKVWLITKGRATHLTVCRA